MAADCGEPVALSATEIAAERAAAEAGVKVTVMVQVAPAARERRSYCLWPKLLAFVPVTEMLVMVSDGGARIGERHGQRPSPPMPTSVLGNASGFGLEHGLGAVPVPLSVADCGDPAALSATEIAALRLPAEPGVKLTVIVQVDSGS